MRRALFLTLLLANLGLFAWYHWYVLPGRADPAPAPSLDGKPLQLMSELTPAQRKAMAASAAPAPATTPVTVATLTMSAGQTTASMTLPPTAASNSGIACASYGPFPSSDAVGQALVRVKALGLNGSQHVVPGKAKLGYWVFLPPFGSHKEADAAADMLRRRGVKDIYVVADEANRNAVSLGVFNQKEGAIQREKDIRKLGLHPQMADRFRDSPHYWLDAKGADSALPAADAFKDLADEDSPVGKATSACVGG